MKELLMGNEAIAMGALAAGVQVVTGYPGTPSSEVLATVAKRAKPGVHVEWSVNEKAAMEVAAGASYAGSRCLVTMKQMGLNVASDPLMCVNYVGVKGGLVVLSADDPGPISSQTEQDSRHFGAFAHIPVLDPSTPEEAFQMIQDAFCLSEEIGGPVILRPTTRVCHACAVIDVPDIPAPKKAEGFQKDPRFVIFPRLSFEAKKKLFAREETLGRRFSDYSFNTLTGSGTVGVAAGGDSAAYAAGAIESLGAEVRFLKVATPYPFPEKKALEFLQGLRQVIVFEELDPVIEDALTAVAGRHHLDVEILGKRSGHTITAGENSENIIASQLAAVLGIPAPQIPHLPADAPALPVRPPVLCAGCPHRASFYAVKTAMKGQNAVFSGDIGCYTLGNAAPLHMVDTCLCMGAGVSIPQGLYHSGNDAVHFGFVGDSTFFHTAIPNIINAVYNGADEVVVVLDNSTTAMTGHQPHPGMGRTATGEAREKLSIERILSAIGVESVRVLDPLDLETAASGVKAAAAEKGVRAIVFRAPCISLVKAKKTANVDTGKCKGCLRCIKELGCPALSVKDGKAYIDNALCNACGLCEHLCAFDAIKGAER